MAFRYTDSVSQSGFTLLELLIALAVFAVIGALAYGGLHSLLAVQAHSEQNAAQLAALQRTFMFLQRDFNQFIERPIRDEFNLEQPALLGQSARIELTRGGWSNPLNQPRSHLQRVAYVLVGKTLERHYWPVLDRAPQAEQRATALLEQVNAISFRYFDNHLTTYYQWPLPSGQEAHLRAVEIILDVEAWGRLRRLFVLPGGVAPPVALTQ